jgi:copper chaperone NosL
MMSRRSRLLVAFGALLMLAACVTPLWRIELIAPQYPEGLGLRIWVSEVRGARPPDLNSVNNLNHYIGMKRIENDAIPELRFMPWILGGLVVTGLAAAALGRPKVVIGWLAGASVVALAGLADFWKWGYDYGHDLDPHAIIKVPGMSYQPPIIGSKQLLNFHATSWPDIGGWSIIAALAVVVLALLLERRRLAAGSLALAVTAACTPSRTPIHFGEDACAHCHMIITDPRFAGQLVTRTGKVYNFDDVGCLAAFVASDAVPGDQVEEVLVHSYVTSDSLLDAAGVLYLQSDELHTPMASGVAALRPGREADSIRAILGGTLHSWREVRTGTSSPLEAVLQ